MALPVVESVASNSSTSGTVTVTAPSGIQVGDLLIGSYTSFRLDGGQTAATPAGFTLVQTSDTTDFRGTVRAFKKVADSADTTASNYVFTSVGAEYMQGSMVRVSGAAPGLEITVSEKDFIASNGSTTINNTGTTTPPTSESIMVLISGGHDASIGAIVTTGTYTSTPSVTWTQRVDLGYNGGSSYGSSHAVATAPYTGTTEFTSYGYATSEVFDQVVSILLVVSSPENATGTNALLQVSPTQFTQAGTTGTTGTNTLHAVSPTMFAQSGNGQRGTPWTNPDKPNTNWNNLPK